VYASLHRCYHGILYPETAQVANVTYVVDPAAPILTGVSICVRSTHYLVLLLWLPF